MMVLRESLSEKEEDELDSKLIDACDDQDINLVRELCLKGARPTYSECLKILAEPRSVKIFNFLWQTKLMNEEQEMLLLDFAAINNNLSLIQYLNENSVKVKNSPRLNSWFKTRTFLCACDCGSLEVVKYLTHSGISTIETGALNRAINNHHIELAKYLIEFIENKNFDKKIINEAVIVGCGRGSVEITSYLIKKFPYLLKENERDLMIAAANCDNVEMIKYLVGNGLNVHMENDEPLVVAIKCRRPEVIKYLITNHDCNLHDLEDSHKKLVEQELFDFNDQVIASRKLNEKLKQDLKETNEKLRKNKI